MIYITHNTQTPIAQRNFSHIVTYTDAGTGAVLQAKVEEGLLDGAMKVWESLGCVIHKIEPTMQQFGPLENPAVLGPTEPFALLSYLASLRVPFRSWPAQTQELYKLTQIKPFPDVHPAYWNPAHFATWPQHWQRAYQMYYGWVQHNPTTYR